MQYKSLQSKRYTVTNDTSLAYILTGKNPVCSHSVEWCETAVWTMSGAWPSINAYYEEEGPMLLPGSLKTLATLAWLAAPLALPSLVPGFGSHH